MDPAVDTSWVHMGFIDGDASIPAAYRGRSPSRDDG